MPEDIGVSTPDVSSPSATTSSSALPDSSSGSVATGAPSGQSSATTQPPVQGQDSQEQDIFADLPSVDELNQQAEQGVKYAKALANLRGQIEPVRTQFNELQTKFTPYEPILQKFEQPEQLQTALELHNQVIGWERAPNGELIPATALGAQMLTEKYPLHADYLAADLLNGETTDPATGRRMSRMDVALSGLSPNSIAQAPNADELKARRAEALRLLGAVEPTSISPQWQATEDQLALVKPELQDVFKSLPYDERQVLSLNDPEFINSQLAKEKLTRELMADKEQTQARERQRVENERAYVRQQAEQAGETYVQTRLSEQYATFANNVVTECSDLIKPLDPANLPQGITAEQVPEINRQIAESNKAVASEVILSVVGLFNPQTRPFALPYLLETGVIDEKTVKQIDELSGGFGDNGRMYGQLEFQGKRSANGNGFQPGPDILNLRNTADQKLKTMVYVANQIKKTLIERHSQFFSLKAQNYNATLNNVAASRPSPNGSTFNPATAASGQLPAGKLSRAEIERMFG